MLMTTWSSICVCLSCTLVKYNVSVRDRSLVLNVEGHAILRGLAGAQAVGLDAQAIVQRRRLRLRHELLVFSLPTRTVEQSYADIRTRRLVLGFG
jgi:hypothetical protein